MTGWSYLARVRQNCGSPQAQAAKSPRHLLRCSLPRSPAGSPDTLERTHSRLRIPPALRERLLPARTRRKANPLPHTPSDRARIGSQLIDSLGPRLCGLPARAADWLRGGGGARPRSSTLKFSLQTQKPSVLKKHRVYFLSISLFFYVRQHSAFAIKPNLH